MKQILLTFVVMLCLVTTSYNQANILPVSRPGFQIGVNINNRISPTGSLEIAYSFDRVFQIGTFAGRSVVIPSDRENTDFKRYGFYAAASILPITQNVHIVSTTRIEVDSKKKHLFQTTGGVSYILQTAKTMTSRSRCTVIRYRGNKNNYVGFSLESGYLRDPSNDGFTVLTGFDGVYGDFILSLRVGEYTMFRFMTTI